MSKIIINQKMCDRSPECGGITNCPNHALIYDEKLKKVVWNKDKCTFCLKCTLPDACPIGAIIFAKDEATEKIIWDTINSDPRDEAWVWQERFGTQPGKPPIAKIIDNSNFTNILNSLEPILIDIWHEKFANCRVHSILYQDFIDKLDIPIYKLDAQSYPQLAKKLEISEFPSIVFLKKGEIKPVKIGPLEESEVTYIIDLIKKLLIK
jgi:thiol-disulfide isomerase/thioredoxin